MAIIKNLGLEVNVLVEGVQAAEYQGGDFSETNDDFAAGTAKCHRYIESVDNAEFAIEVSATKNNPWLKSSNDKHLLNYYIDVDDQEVEGVCLWKDKMYEVLEGVREYRSNAFGLRKFRFSPVHIADDADDAQFGEDGKHVERLGLIRVRVFRATMIKRVREKKSRNFVEISEGGLSLHEGDLKGNDLSHATVPTPPPVDRGSLPRSVPTVLSGDLLGKLPFDEVRRLAQKGLSGTGGRLDNLPLTEIHRLAAATLDNLPFHEVCRLVQQTPSTNDVAQNIKREHDGALVSGRPRKILKTERYKEIIDLTED
ncbi:hypothetical protein SLS53_001282 [Cytospora paraplurivora]|uniref:DUF7918 domain-containing protein n=1 Tax=Cytospora paraplurivora TaxID=2898453 RepID=A0AAN9UK65_9PEZI